MLERETLLVVHDALKGEWLQFERPVRVVIATSVDQVVEKMKEVEFAVEAAGLYAAGYVGYQAAGAFDSRLVTRCGGDLPLMWFGLYETATAIQLPSFRQQAASSTWQSRQPQCDYYRSIEEIKKKIASGDTYQVNYTYPLQCPFSGSAWDYFIHLQNAQQGEYGAFLDLGRFAVCSASPELFFSRNGDEITTRPMKGTAPRGNTVEDDERLRHELAHSAKNQAENLMIVDMLRNDLGRIAQPGSVKVEKLFQVEAYPTVWQMTTQVSARSNCSLVDIFGALFPCSSITGAPKVRTMEIIAELELAPRQLYTGSIGFITPDGRAQFNVAIRTALIDRQQQRAEYSVGGGIIWDSVAEEEYRETQVKAKVLDQQVEPPRILETLLWEPETGYRFFEKHLARLALSAQEFHYPVDLNRLRQQLIDEAAARTCQRWRVRCLVDCRGELLVDFTPQPYRSQRRAVAVVFADAAISSDDPFYRHKTDQRQRFQYQLSQAQQTYGDVIDDVVMFNERNEVTESTIANIVIYHQGQWVTPPLHCGLLAGTFRQTLIEKGVLVERVVTVDQLRAVEQIYLVNSVRGWQWAQLSG